MQSAARAEAGRLRQRLQQLAPSNAGWKEDGQGEGDTAVLPPDPAVAAAEDEARRLRARIVALEHALNDARAHANADTTAPAPAAGEGEQGGGEGGMSGLLAALATANRRVLALEEALRRVEEKEQGAASRPPQGEGEEEVEMEEVKGELDRARQSVLVLTATRDALQAQLEAAMR